MKKLYFLLFCLLAVFIFSPNKALTASNTVMSGFSFRTAGADVDGYKTFKAGIGSTEVFVYLKIGQTKFVGFPVGMRPVVDWQQGDTFNISGELMGYNNGLLIIKANEIKYQTRDVSIIKQEMTVENLDKSDANNYKLVVSSKEKENKYVLTTINKFGQEGGPIITNNTNVDFFVPGTTVLITSIKRKNNNNFSYKIIEVKKTDKPLSAGKRLIDIVKVNDNYQLNQLLVSPVVLARKNQLIIQNSGGGIIYLKNTPDLKRMFNLPSGHSFFTLATNKTQVYSVKNNAPTNNQISLEFYSGTLLNGVLNSPIKVLEIAVTVQ